MGQNSAEISWGVACALRLHHRQHLVQDGLCADDVTIRAQLLRRDADREADELG